MCEAHAYLVDGSEEQRIMENVITLAYEGKELVLTDLFGEQVRLDARIKEIRLLEHKIFLEAGGQ